ncbi:MAG: hypothetical protein R3B99_02310 [Polyangiales bacterium]
MFLFELELEQTHPRGRDLVKLAELGGPRSQPTRAAFQLRFAVAHDRELFFAGEQRDAKLVGRELGLGSRRFGVEPTRPATATAELVLTKLFREVTDDQRAPLDLLLELPNALTTLAKAVFERRDLRRRIRLGAPSISQAGARFGELRFPYRRAASGCSSRLSARSSASRKASASRERPTNASSRIAVFSVFSSRGASSSTAVVNTAAGSSPGSCTTRYASRSGSSSAPIA